MVGGIGMLFNTDHPHLINCTVVPMTPTRNKTAKAVTPPVMVIKAIKVIEPGEEMLQAYNRPYGPNSFLFTGTVLPRLLARRFFV
jgi:hypothetical protein